MPLPLQDAAKRLGWTPAQVRYRTRLLQGTGLLTPRRGSHGAIMYSEDDVAVLDRLRQLEADTGMSTQSAVQALISERPQAEPDDVVGALLAERLERIRHLEDELARAHEQIAWLQAQVLPMLPSRTSWWRRLLGRSSAEGR